MIKGVAQETSYAAFSPDGQWIVTLSGGNTVEIWSKDGTPVATIEKHKDIITHVASQGGTDA